MTYLPVKIATGPRRERLIFVLRHENNLAKYCNIALGAWGSHKSSLVWSQQADAHKFCRQVRLTAALPPSHCSIMWKDCSKQGSVSLCWIYIPSQRRHPSPASLPYLLHQGQECSCWRGTLSGCPPVTSSLTRTLTRVQTCKECFYVTISACACTDHSSATITPLGLASCAQWTSRFLISAVMNQQSWPLRRDVQALVKTQHGLKSTLSHTSSWQ